MKKAMLISVGTGRDGKDIAHAICFSIAQQNPDHIVFLVTDISKKNTMPYIKADIVLEAFTEGDAASERKTYQEIELSNYENVDKVAVQCENIIKALFKKGFKPQGIVIDYTSGTKSMSAGLVFAALNCQVGAIVYVTGDRDREGRVISGTEHSIAVQPNRIFVNLLFEEAIKLFNRYQYDASIVTINKAKTLLSDTEFLKKTEVLEILATIYMKWDKFYIKEAFNLLNQLKRQEEFLKEWGIKNKVESNKEALYQETKNIFCEERMLDLLENARRRGDIEHKYDDAMARLYRLCEYIAQYCVYKRGYYPKRDSKIDTSDIDIERLKKDLPDKYVKYEKYKKNGKIQLSLYALYELLNDIGDPLGKFFVENKNVSKKLLGLRNNSILAHGFNPISKSAYEEMIKEMEKFVRLIVKNNFDKKQKEVRFPTLNYSAIAAGLFGGI